MTAPADEIWSNVLTLLREELPTRTVANWFESADPEVLQRSTPPILRLEVQSSFHRDHVGGRYHSTLAEAAREVLGPETQIQIEVSDDSGEAQVEDPSSPDRAPDKPGTGRGEQRSQGPSPREVTRSSAHTRPRHDRSPSQPSANQDTSDVSVASSPAATSSTDSHDEFHRSRTVRVLKDRYTFDNFVEGDSNALARNASTAVSERPGETKYNPLLIYGGVGLGKTHLAQAIANHSIAERTAEYVCYVSGEKFTSEFVQAIRQGDGEEFSEKYRGVDLLILDDIQFLAGKEKTQEEFFHLFNALHQQNKQIVLCADRPPQDIEGIEERLLSRFQWGLSADIRSPEFEMRLAILQLKTEAFELDIEQEVLDLLAKSITLNVRQLEGALKQLSARASLLGSTIDLDTARRILGDDLNLSESRGPTADDILEAVTAFYGVSQEDLVGRSRRQDQVHPRHVAMYFCRELTSLSLSAIGTRFAGRDHSTISHAHQKVSDRLDVEPQLEKELTQVRREIQKYAVRR